MKVQLVVVQGKPEGKVIPLIGPTFKIGRGETCHLRPNSERVSREHAEFSLTVDGVAVRDLGSRNGTLVNGKAVTNGTIHKLNDRDLVQIGPLTFAVAVLEPFASVVKEVSPSAPVSKVSPDDISNDEIDNWIVGEGGGSTVDLPTTLYTGETQTITAFHDPAKKKLAPAPIPAKVQAQPTPSLQVEVIDQVEEERIEELDNQYEEDEDDDSDGEDDETPIEDFVDESNPFQAAKTAQKQSVGPSKPLFKDTSDAAHDILRKLMQQRKAAKTS